MYVEISELKIGRF